MKTNLLFILFASALMILSCRLETEIIEESEAKPFAVFTKNSIYSKNKTTFDYAKAFGYLAGRYDEIHETNFTGLMNGSNGSVYDKNIQQNFISKSVESYIEFRIHSQIIEEDNGTRWVIYPRIEDEIVVELIIAALLEDDAIVGFYTFENDSEFYATYVDDFQEKFDEHFITYEKNKVQIVFSESLCGFVGEEPCEIDGVILSGPAIHSLVSEIFHDFYDWEFFGPCEAYGDCGSGGGGGGGNSVGGYGSANNDEDQADSSENNPCEQTNKLIVNEDVISKIDSLISQSQLETGNEKAFIIKSDNSTSSLIDGGKHHVNLENHLVGNIGVYHNHTVVGINMFSVGDIRLLFSKMITLPPGIKYDEAFIGIVVKEETTPGYFNTFNYIIRYTGNTVNVESAYLASNNLTPDQIERLEKRYIDTDKKLSNIPELTDNYGATLNSKGLEKLFFETLKNMDIDETSITLQKINTNTNEIININSDENGTLIETSCL